MDIPLRRPSAPLRASRALLVLALLVGACSSGANPGGTGSVPGSATSSVPAATPPGASAGTGSPGASGATGPSCGPDAASYPGWPSGPPQTPPEIIPILVSQDVSVGRNRFLMTLIDQQNELVASPDLAVTLRFFDLAADPATPRVEVPGSFLSLSGDERGLYRAGVDFACAGTWGVEVVARGGGRPDRTARAVFSVRPSSATPAIGAPAPTTETPTAATAEEIRRISTDPQPAPDFYRLSVADALAARRPFLLAFSTPAFCKTRTCGPALEVVKQVAPAFKDAHRWIFRGRAKHPLDLGSTLAEMPPQETADIRLPVLKARLH